MAQTIWCRYEDCREPYYSLAGDRPAFCPKCKKPQRWVTTKDGLPERRKHGKGPRVKFDLNHNDYKLFLKRIRVSAD